MLSGSALGQPPIDCDGTSCAVAGSLTDNVTFEAGNTYLLHGQGVVEEPAVLTVVAGLDGPCPPMTGWPMMTRAAWRCGTSVFTLEAVTRADLHDEIASVLDARLDEFERRLMWWYFG